MENVMWEYESAMEKRNPFRFVSEAQEVARSTATLAARGAFPF